MYIPLFIGIFITFLFLNGKIILSDIREKKIPNKYLLSLLSLLPVFYVYLFLTKQIPNGVLIFFIQIIIALFISFLLYYYGVWSAGDAKYLLVLSFYLPIAGIIPFIGNLSLITIIYLLCYYIYFYGSLLFRGAVYRNSLFTNIFTDQKDTLKIFLNKHKINQIETKNAIYNALRFILIFLMLFVIFRLIRGYLLEDIKKIGIVRLYAIQYSTYFIFIVGGFFFFIFYYLKKILVKFKTGLTEVTAKYLSPLQRETLFALFLFFALFSFLFHEYMINSGEIIHKLFLIFTLYLGIFFLFKILFYSYKITFQLGEEDIIPLSKLQLGDIVDKDYLVRLFGTQKSLGYGEKKGLLAPNPQEYFQNMENPIDGDTFTILKKIYFQVNYYHKKQKTSGFEKVQNIKILKMFSFGIYIFIGFIITFIWGELPFRIIVGNVLRILHSPY